MGHFDTLLADLDQKLGTYSTKLRDDLGIEPPTSLRLATAIRAEIRAFPLHSLPTLEGDSPLALKDRLEMLTRLVGYLQSRSADPDSFGRLVSINYTVFVFLGEACFKVLRKELPSGTVAQKCCAYLTDNPVRAFRNALAHGNWRFIPDYSGIDFWAKKGADPKEDMVRWRATDNDLSFWQCLGIATALSVMTSL